MIPIKIIYKFQHVMPFMMVKTLPMQSTIVKKKAMEKKKKTYAQTFATHNDK
jgi:hypothetical protein